VAAEATGVASAARLVFAPIPGAPVRSVIIRRLQAGFTTAPPFTVFTLG
jgi:hypothetical protein